MRYLYEVLAVVLVLASLLFFRESIDYLSRRDYVAALLMVFIGVSIITAGKEMARISLASRD